MNPICVMPLGRCKCGIQALHSLITFWNSQHCCLANVRARIRRAFLIAKTTILPIIGTLIPLNTRNAIALISGLLSARSF